MNHLLSEPGGRRHALCLSLLLALSLTSGSRVVGAGSDPAAEQTARLQQLRARIGELKNDLGSIRGEKRALDGELEKTEKEISTLTAVLRGLERKIDASRQQLDQLAEQRANRHQQLQGMRSDLVRDLRSAYRMGKQEQVKLLLNQEDPALVGRMLIYHDYFSRARAGHLRAIRTALDDLAAIEQEVMHQKATLETLRSRQLEESRHLKQMQSQRKAVIAKLQTELEKKSGQLTTLQKDEQDLQQLVQSLQVALREIPSTAGQFESLPGRKGRLLWPVTGRIGRGYGVRHAEGKLTSRGIFLSAPGGTEVHAISRGRVAFADWLRGFGLLLIIDHGSGYMSLYGHNSSLFKEPGEWVEENEVIALVGSSGGQQRTGLYLELRKHGRPFDPASWFAGKPEQQHAGR
jgi:septal ring factor EnvC (AmiA/AmiB activator)